MKNKKKMGRPPPPWIYDLASSQRPHDGLFRASEIASWYDNLTPKSVANFLAKNSVPGEYIKNEGRGIVKHYRVKDLKLAAQNLVDSYAGH